MPSKDEHKKRNKAHNPDRRRQGRNRAGSNFTSITRLAPTNPIPRLTVLTSPPELKTGKKWCFDASTPVYYAPDEPSPSERFPKGTVLGLTGQTLGTSVEGIKTSWSEIAYKRCNGQGVPEWVIGWINDAYLDDYIEKDRDAGVVIPHPTPVSWDAQQYIVWEGIARHNLCGEFCVAFIVNDDIDSVLTKWKAHSQSGYNSILGGDRDKTTSDIQLKGMLDDILDQYGYPPENDRVIYLRETLTYPVDPSGLLEDLQKMLTTHYLITGVWAYTENVGELIRNHSTVGQGHWVVLDKITHNGNCFEIYNPFLNRREEYSLSEFYISFSTASGLWVKRKEICPGSPIENLPVFEVTIENPNTGPGAKQYINVDGKRKTNLCGEFCVAFILQESIEAVLKRWKEAQPILYADTVGVNEGTGTDHLATILRAYGYNTKGDFTGFGSGLTDPFLKRCLISPGRIAKMLETHSLIVGVNIDGRTGILKRGNKVPHWVVLEKLTLVGKDMGWAEIYNPFNNRWEEYSYREFTNSLVDGYWSGLWVKRNIVPVYIPQPVIVLDNEGKSGKNARITQWPKEKLAAAIRQKVKLGKSMGKIVGELAGLSGWKRNRIMGEFKSIQSGGPGIWADTRIREEIWKQRKNGKSINKISPEKLSQLSGWKLADVQAVLKKIAEAEKWSTAQVRREIENHIENRKLKDKTLVKLVQTSGWKKAEIRQVFHSVMETRKWTAPQVLEGLRSQLRITRSAEKAIDEVIKLSGWHKRDLKKLVRAQKWAEDQVRHEMEQLLSTGKSLNKVLKDLALVSGWTNSEITRKFQLIKETKATETKKRITVEMAIVVDPATIVHASKPLAEFVKWQDSLLSVPGSQLYRIRKWGDEVMKRYDFDVNQIGGSNFQAVGLYNDGNKEFGAITNFIRISHAEVMRMKAMQIEDDYEDKVENWRRQKMNWLCNGRGSIYFWDKPPEEWPRALHMRWGTLALGGNLVQVIGTATLRAKMRDGVTGPVKMARLKGFTESDWGRPLDDLLTEGLVHRCFCAYKGNDFGDTPKGIIYSPFFSPLGRDFAGKAEATALYIPVEWLEPKNS